jgi:hypothetical protein
MVEFTLLGNPTKDRGSRGERLSPGLPSFLQQGVDVGPEFLECLAFGGGQFFQGGLDAKGGEVGVGLPVVIQRYST